jgi:drug/metabolite transporter (DMT)-like permease
VGVTAVWGSTFVLVRDAVEQIPPFTFIAYRFLAAALLLAALRPRLAAGGQPGLVGAGAVAGLALFAGLLLRQPPGRWPVAGALLAAVGLACLSLQSLEVRRGDALVLGCAVAFAAHILLLGRYAPRFSTYRLAVVQLASAGLLALAWAALAGDLVVPGSAEVWVALLITSVAASAGAFLIQTRAQREVSPTRTAVILTMEPVFAGLFGFLLAGERLSGRGWLGAGLILAGMLVAELGGRQPAAPGRPATDGGRP